MIDEICQVRNLFLCKEVAVSLKGSKSGIAHADVSFPDGGSEKSR